MAKNSINTATRYFTQKNRDKLESVLFAGGVVGIIVCIVGWLTYYWYYSMIGLYVGGSCILTYIILTSKKVKDEGYDAHVREFIEKNSLEPKSSYKLKLFDGERGYVKLGKDRKIRSSVYCISEFDFGREEFSLKVSEIDFCASAEGAPQVKERSYTLPLGTPTSVEEVTVDAPEGKKAVQYLVISPEDGARIRIPADITSCDTDEIIEKIKRRR